MLFETEDNARAHIRVYVCGSTNYFNYSANTS